MQLASRATSETLNKEQRTTDSSTVDGEYLGSGKTSLRRPRMTDAEQTQLTGSTEPQTILSSRAPHTHPTGRYTQKNWSQTEVRQEASLVSGAPGRRPRAPEHAARRRACQSQSTTGSSIRVELPISLNQSTCDSSSHSWCCSLKGGALLLCVCECRFIILS